MAVRAYIDYIDYDGTHVFTTVPAWQLSAEALKNQFNQRLDGSPGWEFLGMKGQRRVRREYRQMWRLYQRKKEAVR